MHMAKMALVRLRENHLLMAVVVGTMKGIRGGRELDRPLAGFRYWNTAELELVPSTSPLRRFWRR